MLAAVAVGCAVDSPDETRDDGPAPVVMEGPAWDAVPEAADDLRPASTPVHGGTLLALTSGRVAASNIDQDTVVFPDPASGTVTGNVAVPEHSEPGRLAEGIDSQVPVLVAYLETL